MSNFVEGATPDSYANDGSRTDGFVAAPVDASAPAPQVSAVPAETDGYRGAQGVVRGSIRDRLAARRPYVSEIVEVEEWEEKFEVRSIALGVRNDMLASVIDPETKEADTQKLYPELIIRSTYDPETGLRVFADDDLAFINGLAAGPSDKLAKAAMKLSGMTDDAKDKEAGKSSETETSVSPS